MSVVIGIYAFSKEIVTWVTGEVFALGGGVRRKLRTPVKDRYSFRGGGKFESNLRASLAALKDNAYVSHTGFVSKSIRDCFMTSFETIGFQMELLSRLTPSAFEVEEGETPIILWSVEIPHGAWVLVVTAVGQHCIYYFTLL
jgi:hypothetical protein